jgi:hypothetical protein
VRSLAAGLLVSLAAAAPEAPDRAPGTPRLILKIAGAAGPDEIRATIENVAGEPLAITVVPAFVLRPTGAAEAGWPSFRAPADLATARPLPKNGSARLHLAAGQQLSAVVALESLHWDHYSSVFWPFRPLRRVALPGRYELSLEVRDPDSTFVWTSNSVPAVVRKSGALQIVKPD